MTWKASLDLSYRRHEGQLVYRSCHQGPLLVQKPFFASNRQSVQHYILHPPGGLVGGDELSIHVSADAQASVLLTSPSAQKVYRQSDQCVQIEQVFEVHRGSSLLWLPQESIYFDNCCLRSSSDIHLHQGGQCVYWDIHVFGRAACDERFQQGSVHSSLTVYRDGKRLFSDALRVEKERAWLDTALGLRNYRSYGQMIICSEQSELLLRTIQQRLAEQNIELDPCCQALVCRGEMLIVRMLHHQSFEIRDFFIGILEIANQTLQLNYFEPRIWSC
jgi:urease accessory protein